MPLRNGGRLALLLVSLALVAGCYKVDTPHFTEPDDAGTVDGAVIDAGTDGPEAPDAAIDGPPGTYHVGGSVTGMWTNATVSVHLSAGAVDETKVLTANTGFNFDMVVPADTAFTVTIETLPAQHACTLSNNTGTVSDADVTNIGIDCSGPSVGITLSAPITLTFDDDTTTYALDSSVIIQETGLTVTAAAATQITLNGSIPLTSGTASSLVPLALGDNTLAVKVDVGALTRTYSVGIDRGGAVVARSAYVKSTNSEAGDYVAFCVAADGDRIAVGAKNEDSNTTGVNGQQSNNLATESGAVFVFRRSGLTWIQEAFIKPSNTDMLDGFGCAIALSGDTLAVGAPGEDSSATGVNSTNQGNDSGTLQSGAVYVFRRAGTTWSQEAYVKASNTGPSDAFGDALALDGNMLVVGTPADASAQGRVFVFTRSGSTWSQQTEFQGPTPVNADYFGKSLAISGGTLAVGAIGRDPLPVVYIYTGAGATWSLQATVTAANEEALDSFATSVALDGEVLAVGAPSEDSADAANPNNNGASQSGAAYIFRRSGTTWSQEDYVKPDVIGSNDFFGTSVALVNDILAVGAYGDDSTATGVNGTDDNAAPSGGAGYVFARIGTNWSQHAYVKGAYVDDGDVMGFSVGLSTTSAIVSNHFDDSFSTGIDGDETSNGATDSGAAHTYR